MSDLEIKPGKYSDAEYWEMSRSRWQKDLTPENMTWGRVWDGHAFARALLQFTQFSPSTTLLEIGPGYGRVLKSLLELKIPFGKYVGIELSEASAHRLNEEFKDVANVEFLHGDGELLQLEEKFDLCFCSTTFAFFYPTFEPVVRNIARHLVDDGQLIFDFPWGRDKTTFQEDSKTFVRSYSQSSIRALMTGLGFGNIAFSEVTHGLSSENKEVTCGVCSALNKNIPADKNIYDIPVPSEDLIFLVVGNRRSEEFVYSGEQSLIKVIDAIQQAGQNVADMKRILEWGCGCGRITRHWLPLGEDHEVYGCDIGPDLIAWCQENLEFAEFTQCDMLPPTIYESSFFDLMYAGSVLTHLDFREHMLWMLEVHRLLSKKGVAILTYHGAHYLFARRMDPTFGLTLLGEEPFAVSGDGTPGSNQINSYATLGAMQWLFYPFDVLWNGPRQCILGEQSTLVLQKKCDVEAIPLFPDFSSEVRLSHRDDVWSTCVSRDVSGQSTCVAFLRKEGEQTTFSVKITITDKETGDALGETEYHNTCGRRTFYYKGGAIYHPVVLQFKPSPSGEVNVQFELLRTEIDGEGDLVFDFVYFF